MRLQPLSFIPYLLPLVSSHAVHAPRQDPWGDGHAQAKASIDAMMTFYNQSAGQWQPEVAWWLSGNALQVLLDYTLASNSTTYTPEVLRTIDAQKEPLAWWPQGGGYFRADSTDDTGWWALAMVRMYDVSGGDATYLDYARLDEAYMRSYWSDEIGRAHV